MKITITRPKDWYVSVSFLSRDPEDGTQEGWYAWVNDRGDDDQSDFAIGPCDSEALAHRRAEQYLKGEWSPKRTRKCMLCLVEIEDAPPDVHHCGPCCGITNETRRPKLRRVK